MFGIKFKSVIMFLVGEINDVAHLNCKLYIMFLKLVIEFRIRFDSFIPQTLPPTYCRETHVRPTKKKKTNA